MATANLEANSKNKLKIIHVKLSKIKDADLARAATRLSLKNEMARFRELLVDMETGFCKRLEETEECKPNKR